LRVCCVEPAQLLSPACSGGWNANCIPDHSPAAAAVATAVLAPQVALDVQQHTTMAALQQRVSSRDKIVGWFSTGNPDVSRSRDALIHSFYGNECANPVS
jgi:hypothetical protein